MVGSAGCGNGVPMWFQQKAAPELIGKPLVTDFPYSLIMPIDKVAKACQPLPHFICPIYA
jgi:hypothetical protein